MEIFGIDIYSVKHCSKMRRLKFEDEKVWRKKFARAWNGKKVRVSTLGDFSLSCDTIRILR